MLMEGFEERDGDLFPNDNPGSGHTSSVEHWETIV